MMKIKTFSGTSIDDVDDKVNAFENDHNVKATQTRSVVHNGLVIHYYTVFYLEDK